MDFDDLDGEELLDFNLFEEPLDLEQLLDPDTTQSVLSSTETEAEAAGEKARNEVKNVDEGSERKVGRPKGSFKVSNETEEERKKRIADINRRYRARKRDKMQQLKRKNEELEHDKELLQDRIACLQLEAQMLRGNGTVSLEKENKLIRAEIQQHKKFLREVVALTQGTEHISVAERDRILATGLASTVGQTLGLLYTSVVDSSWGKWFHGDLENHELLVAGQFLPRGATRETSVFQNFRIDTWTKAYNATEAAEFLWENNGLMDLLPKKLKEVAKLEFGDIKAHLVLEDSSPAGPNNQRIRVFQLREDFEDKSKPGSDMLYAFGRQTCSISTSAFSQYILDAHPELQTGDLLEAQIISLSSSKTFSEKMSEYVPLEEGSVRVEHTTMQSFLIVDLPGSGCHISIIVSTPTKMSGSFGLDLTEPYLLDGKITPFFTAHLKTVLQVLNSIKDHEAAP